MLSVVVLTNNFELSDLKQHTSNVFHFYRLEVPHRSPYAKVKVSSGLCSIMKALWENPRPSLFQLLETTHILWFIDHFLCLQNQQRHVSLTLLQLSHLFLTTASKAPLFFNCAHDDIGLTQIIQGKPPQVKVSCLTALVISETSVLFAK